MAPRERRPPGSASPSRQRVALPATRRPAGNPSPSLDEPTVVCHPRDGTHDKAFGYEDRYLFYSLNSACKSNSTASRPVMPN